MKKQNLQNTYDVNQIESQNTYLKQQIQELQTQLSLQVQQNDQLHSRLQSLDSENQKLKSQLQKQAEARTYQNLQTQDIHFRYNELSQGHDNLLENMRAHCHTMQKELETKNEEIAKLRHQIDEKVNKLNVVNVTQDRSMQRCMDLNRQVEELNLEKEEYEKKYQKAQHELQMLQLQKKSEGTFLVEVEHLRGDVKRLLQMLKNTTEYKEFASLAEDSTHSIRFLKDIKARSYVDAGCISQCKNIVRECLCPPKQEFVEDEKMLWVPEETFRFAHEFRLKYQGELTDVLIEKLLFELNKIWSRRENRIIQRVKGNAAHEIAALRRQLAFNPKYDEFQQKQRITMLENQLKNCYKENRENFAQREQRNPFGTGYITETLKTNKDLCKCKKQFKKEVNGLKNQIEGYEKEKYQHNNIKAVFMEGALWMGKKVASEVASLQNNVNAQGKALHEKQEQILNGGDGWDLQNIMRKCDWFLENVDGEINGFKQKVQQFNRFSEKDMIEANQIIDKVQKIKTGVVTNYY